MGKIPDAIEGMSRIRRGGEVIWEKPFVTGEANMSHTLANLEYHHFKYDGFRRPAISTSTISARPRSRSPMASARRTATSSRSRPPPSEHP